MNRSDSENDNGMQEGNEKHPSYRETAVRVKKSNNNIPGLSQHN